MLLAAAQTQIKQNGMAPDGNSVRAIVLAPHSARYTGCCEVNLWLFCSWMLYLLIIDDIYF